MTAFPHLIRADITGRGAKTTIPSSSHMNIRGVNKGGAPSSGIDAQLGGYSDDSMNAKKTRKNNKIAIPI